MDLSGESNYFTDPFSPRDDSPYLLLQSIDIGEPWTATRCDQLLQPLRSQIANLREYKIAVESEKLPANQTLEPKKSNQSRSSDNISTDRASKSLFDKSQSDNQTDVDSSWELNSRPSKKPKHTYTKRARAAVNSRRRNLRNGSHYSFEIPLSRSPRQLNPIQLDFQKPSSNSERGSASAESGERVEFTETSIPRINLAQVWPDLDRSRKAIACLLTHKPNIHWRLVDRIHTTFSSLLFSTAGHGGTRTSGCRSLFSTCVRNVPQYIAYENCSREGSPDNEKDTALEIYHDLEEFGSPGRCGWQPLKEIVRFGALKLISEIIEEGLVGTAIARQLILFCVTQGAFDEAQILLEALFTLISTKTKPQPPDDSIAYEQTLAIQHERQLAVDTLFEFSSQTQRYRVLYYHLARLLVDDRPFLTCMPEDSVRRVLDKACNAVGRNDWFSPEAANFILLLIKKSYTLGSFCTETEIHRLRVGTLGISVKHCSTDSKTDVRAIQRPDHEIGHGSIRNDGSDTKIPSWLQRTILSLLHSLNFRSIKGFVTENQKSRMEKELFLDIFSRIAVEALQSMVLDGNNPPQRTSSKCIPEQIIHPLLGVLFATRDKNYTRSELDTIEPQLIDTLGHVCTAQSAKKNAISFMSRILRGIDLAHKVQIAFSTLKDIVQSFVIINAVSDPDMLFQKHFAEVLVAVSFAFCTGTGKTEHFDWVMGIGKELKEKINQVEGSDTDKINNQGKSLRKPEYRWDEGMSEWISKAPTAPATDTNEDWQRCQSGTSFSKNMRQPASLSSDLPLTQFKENERNEAPSSREASTDAAENETYCSRTSADDMHARHGPLSENSHSEFQMQCEKGEESDELLAPHYPLRVTKATRRKPPCLHEMERRDLVADHSGFDVRFGATRAPGQPSRNRSFQREQGMEEDELSMA